MSYSEAMNEDLRLRVLQTLAGSPAFTQNEMAIKGTLIQSYGHAVSRDRLRSELAWIGEQGLLVVQQIGGAAPVWIATLTGRGEDCAAGLAIIPGVARPRAGG